MAQKKSFVMAYDHQALFQQLSDEQAGKLIKAIYAYEIDGINPEFTDPLLIAFFTGVLKPFVDMNKEKYDKKCKKNSENIAKRWNKSNTNVNECIQTDTTVYDRIRNIQTNTNDTKNTDYEYDYEYDNDISKVGIVNIEDARACEEDSLPDSPPAMEHLNVISFYQENIDSLMSSYVSECIKDDCDQYGEENVLAAMQQAKLANKKNYKYIRATAKGKYNDAVYGPSEAYQARQKESALPKKFSEDTCLSGMKDLLESRGFKVND